MSISKVFSFRKWSFLFTPSDKATKDMTHDYSYDYEHAQRDGWGELISRYGKRVSPSASHGEGELTSAGRLSLYTLNTKDRSK